MASTLITGGTVVTDRDAQRLDLLIDGEQITALGPDLARQYPQARQVDATGCYVLPGGIDPHTHLEMPFMGTTSSDDFETGTRAALFGGTTTIIDFAMQRPGDSLTNTLRHWQAMAEKSLTDYSFHIAITDLNDTTRLEISRLIEEEGIRSFKVFMAYKQALMVPDEALLAILEETARHGAKVLAHCEHGDLIDWLVQRAKALGHGADPRQHALTRPPVVEAEATGRFCDLAWVTRGHPYVVHLSCEQALERIRRARRERGQRVWAETCIQYLTLDERLYEREDAAKWVFSPPLRNLTDIEALWQALAHNEIDTVATDHCPFCLEQKAAGVQDFTKIPNGMPGIEHRMTLLFSEGVVKGCITLPQFVALTSANAARAFDLYPRKGSLSVGADADVVVFDPAMEHVLSSETHHMRCDYSAFEGWRVTGQVRSLWRRGEPVIADGQCLAPRGSGHFLARPYGEVAGTCNAPPDSHPGKTT